MAAKQAQAVPITQEIVRKPPTMLDAMGQAKGAVAEMTGLKVDAVSRCVKEDDGSWAVTIDVVESAARMGDNDLLSAYELQLSPDLELLNFARLKRYHREDRD